MIKRNQDEVIPKQVKSKGCKKVEMQWLCSKREGAPNFALRRFTIRDGGFIPVHSHPWEHEIYVLSGEGSIFDGDVSFHAKRGDVFFIGKNEKHGYCVEQLRTESFVFLCVVPNMADKRDVKCYTLLDLKNEGKISCTECVHRIDFCCTNLYPMRIQPEELYLMANGQVIGCKYGERK